MTSPNTPNTDRWYPDDQLVPAILAGGPHTAATMGDADRAWAVAGLRLAGLSITDIADRLECSKRTVLAISADPLCILAGLYQRSHEASRDELRMTASEVRRLDAALREARRDRDRYKAQLDRMVDRMLTAAPTTPGHSDAAVFPRCRHPRTRYNTYIAPVTGKASCRKCRAAAQRRYRARRAGQTSPTNACHSDDQNTPASTPPPSPGGAVSGTTGAVAGESVPYMQPAHQ